MSEAKAPAEKSKKKGTAATEVVIGSAASKIKNSVKALKDAVTEVEGLSERAEEMQGIIAQREDRIKELDVEYSEKKRQKEVDLSVKLREDERGTVEGILSKQGLVAVNQDEYNTLKTDKTKIETEAKNDAARQIAAATGAMSKDHKAELELQKAKFAQEQAETSAKLSNAENQIAFLKEQAEMWKSALDAERTAGVERAKASAVGHITIGNTGK